METTAPIPRQAVAARWLIAAVYIASMIIPLRVLDALPVVCPFRRFTGLPCPGCGGTHAFVAMAHGQFHAPWAYNPLGVIAFIWGLAWLGLAQTGRAPRLGGRARAWVGAACFVIALAFGAWRILGLHAAPG